MQYVIIYFPYSLAANLHNGTLIKIKITAIPHSPNPSDTGHVTDIYPMVYYLVGSEINYQIPV